MRLWTLHPRYLDPQGLVALWREALLARAVVRGETIGYRHHPQLLRFTQHAAPRSVIDAYLATIHREASARGYRFDRAKFGRVRQVAPIATTVGQLEYEWTHLMRKLRARSPAAYRRWRVERRPQANALFQIVPGPVEAWEVTRLRGASGSP